MKKIKLLLLFYFAFIFHSFGQETQSSSSINNQKVKKNINAPNNERYLLGSSAFMPDKGRMQYFNNFFLINHFEYVPHSNISLQAGLIPFGGIPTSIKIGKKITPRFAVALEMRNLWLFHLNDQFYLGEKIG